MIDFSKVHNLVKQHTFIKAKINSSKAIFLVGGCIRNILLDIDHNPNDIDITLAGNPIEIYKKSKKTGLSHFMTEKFGTITLIKKGKKTSQDVQYEITPLRTESGYEDFRHPGEINRCNDIILDSQRRDFTINSLYFFTDNNCKTDNKNQNISTIEYVELLRGLKNNGIIDIPQNNLLIIQNHEIITTLFKNGIYQKDQLTSVIKKYKLDKNSEYCYFIIDPNLGIQDLINKKICAVGDPDKRFQEDSLRLLRGIRFVNVINHKLKEKKKEVKLFDFDKTTRNSIKTNHKLLGNIAKERIKDELLKSFQKGDSFGFVSLLDEAGLLEIIFPCVYQTKNVNQPVRFHPFDVYTHTMLALYELQKINKNYLVRLAMLYHDVGKVAQFEAYKDNLSKEEIRAILSGPLNHRKGGPELVKKDLSALGLSNKEIDQVARYVANHHKPEEILDTEDNEQRKKKLRKFLSEAGEQKVKDIFDITIADRLGQYNPLQNSSDLSEINILRKLLKQINDEEGQFTIKQLIINGDKIMKHFKIPPGKLVGELLQKAFEWVLNDIKNRNKKREIIAYLSGYLKNKKSNHTEIL